MQTLCSYGPPLLMGSSQYQGRHHGFESGGDKICERSEQKKFFDPPTFGACRGYKKISWHFTLQSKIGILERTYKKFYVFNQ
jgi:hypothetical protein